MRPFIIVRAGITLISAFGASEAARGQASPVFTAKGAFLALSVADLDASTKWHAEKFGLTVVMRPPKQDKSSVAVLEGGGLIVGRIVRLTPNGLSVSSRVLAISFARSAGVGCVSAVRKPSAPELATAATSSARPRAGRVWMPSRAGSRTWPTWTSSTPGSRTAAHGWSASSA